MPRLDAQTLQTLILEHLQATGVSEASAQHVASATVSTSLRGVDSHGINLVPHYVRAVQGGRINGQPRITVEATGPSAARVDADHAFGHHAGAHAMDVAMDAAAQTGVGIASVRNSTHFGAAAYFALRAPPRGMLGLAFTNADALVKAFNARTSFFGTNPVCFTAPLADEDPLCLDMATSRVAWNRVKEKRLAGATLPPGWACDANGEPTTVAEDARSLEPAGDYKGFGLGMMVEVLCSLLSGGPSALDLLPMYTAPLSSKRHISHCFMAVDVARFVPVEQFSARLQNLVTAVRQLPSSGAAVMVPGDPEKLAARTRTVDGIPISETTWREFLELQARFKEAERS